MGLAEGDVSDYVHVYIYRYDWIYCLIRPPIGEGPYHVGIFYEMMGIFFRALCSPVKFHNPHLGFLINTFYHWGTEAMGGLF